MFLRTNMKVENGGTPEILCYSNSPSNARGLGVVAIKLIGLDMLDKNRTDSSYVQGYVNADSCRPIP